MPPPKRAAAAKLTWITDEANLSILISYDCAREIIAVKMVQSALLILHKIHAREVRQLNVAGRHMAALKHNCA